MNLKKSGAHYSLNGLLAYQNALGNGRLENAQPSVFSYLSGDAQKGPSKTKE
jgi:hypothetical protein